ncbi:MAG: CRISPR-associated protein Cas4 [Actinomycetota bacterium]
MTFDDEVVNLSEIEHYAYCRRQWALISIDQSWADNLATSVGHLVHERVDREEVRNEKGRRVARSLVIWSDQHRLYGRADTVEFSEDGTPFPVEHKSGSRNLLPAILQLSAQALCLEEMFDLPVDHGAIWSHARRRRQELELTDSLKRQALDVAGSVRSSRQDRRLPSAVFDGRCPNCSLINECLPRLVSDRRRVLALHNGLFDPGPEFR